MRFSIRAMAMAHTDGVEAAAKVGRPKAGAGKADNIRLKPSYGTAAANIVARLKRDRPDIAERLAR
jgi:hypothetical protein